MADGRVEPLTTGVRTQPVWTELFRSFQVALDPRKLLLAAAGIFVTALGWYLLSTIFFGMVSEPKPDAPAYSKDETAKRLGAKKSDGTEYKIEEYGAEGDKQYNHDRAQWETLNSLAGPGGSIRTMPWNEYRGENPFLIIADEPSAGKVIDYIVGQIPFLVEPLSKLLQPIIKLLDPTVSFLTRIYLILALLWSVAVWAFFGGVITRLAAVQLGGKEQITLGQAVRFVKNRYISYVLSPIVPLGIIAVIVFAMSIYGLVALIPIVGDVFLYGLGLPLVILGGIVMAILLIGLIGYPLMYTTISTEGSDTFDALSRAYNYVFQAPWQYLWYAFVSVVYGACVTFVVIVISCLMVYLGKWAVSQPANLIAHDRKPDFLFIYSPESYGWRELMLKGSPVELNPKTPKYSATLSKADKATGYQLADASNPAKEAADRTAEAVKRANDAVTAAAKKFADAESAETKATGEPGKGDATKARLEAKIELERANTILADAKTADAAAQESKMYGKFRNPPAAKQYFKDMQIWNYIGAGMATFWMVLVFLLMIGFSYSYFWSASTVIYLLMRKKVDEVDIDEVYIEDDSAPPISPPIPPVSPPSAPGATSLPTVPPPAVVATSTPVTPPPVPPFIPPPPPTDIPPTTLN